MIRKVCNRTCFSFGIHVDFKKRYIDLHLWNYFFSTSNGNYSNIPHKLFIAYNKMCEKNRASEEQFLKDNLPKDYHAILI